MATATTLLTAEEYWEHPSSDWSELIDGMIVDVALPGAEHGRVQALLITLLLEAQQRGNGRVLGRIGCVIRRNPDVVRAADIAFIRSERLPSGRLPKGFWDGAPDLAVEIVSPGDRPGEIQTKIREWIEAGALQAWVVYPDNRTVHVVRSLQDRVTLNEDDILEGGDAVPGFSCRVSDVFSS